jgi:hypothetical protein
LLDYQILKPVPERHLLTPDKPGIVEPSVPHEVAPIGPVRFYVEFHAKPDKTQPPAESLT